MKTLVLPFLVGLALATSALRAEVSAQAWLESYYLNPQPAALAARVQALSREGFLERPGNVPLTIGFLAIVFAQHPTRVDGWLQELRSLPESHQRLLAAALWQAEAAWTDDEDLFRTATAPDAGDTGSSPLTPMSPTERLRADFELTGLTTGAHPMALVRDQLPDVWRATDLPLARDGETLTVAGSVICRQRPGTAKGFLFISLEDETGIANVVVTPQMFEERRLVITQEPALRVTGRVQNRAGVIHVKAAEITALAETAVPAGASHDFH